MREKEIVKGQEREDIRGFNLERKENEIVFRIDCKGGREKRQESVGKIKIEET